MKLNFQRVLMVVAMSSSFGANMGIAQETAQRLSRAELIQRRAATQERRTKLMAKESTVEKSHPSQSSILDRSSVIGDGRNWTIVPKGAVMFLPEKYQKRLDAEPQGRYVEFSEFIVKNRGWVAVQNVTLQQARGEVPIGDGLRAGFEKSGRLVVSVFQNGPITIRPFKTSPPQTASN